MVVSADQRSELGRVSDMDASGYELLYILNDINFSFW